MGFTQYWKFERTAVSPEVLAAQFAKAAADIRLLMKELESQPDPIKFGGWDSDAIGSLPVITDCLVSFNGVGEDGHESFVIEKEDPHCFEFCKTARKPYDILVCAALLAFSRQFGDSFTPTTDGRYEDWKPAIELVNRVLGINSIAYAPADVQEEADAH